ncbi:hypothetical protein [Paenibacillus roseipurpureus]|uniref:Xylose isomerase-like TIM barrel domain-containing protein n=1 Tax=Paenibacillus roseopurpureus TaxID=2918901 RepID=A0AA96LRP8_9BACL|nr:hypothetical protein [Paenibacillus sp. MBLB1832]WNR45989.1 hypothetical protein MJB10_07810 [Paenibacillus sp. MBLB1832]
MKFAIFTVMMPHYNPIEALDALQRAGYDGVEWRVAQVQALSCQYGIKGLI